MNDELMEETSRYSCKYIFKNKPDNTFEDSYEESQKEEEHMCLKPPTIKGTILREYFQTY